MSWRNCALSVSLLATMLASSACDSQANGASCEVFPRASIVAGNTNNMGWFGRLRALMEGRRHERRWLPVIAVRG